MPNCTKAEPKNGEIVRTTVVGRVRCVYLLRCVVIKVERLADSGGYLVWFECVVIYYNLTKNYKYFNTNLSSSLNDVHPKPPNM